MQNYFLKAFNQTNICTIISYFFENSQRERLYFFLRKNIDTVTILSKEIKSNI